MEKELTKKPGATEKEEATEITDNDLTNLNEIFKVAQQSVAANENEYARLIMFKQQLFAKLQNLMKNDKGNGQESKGDNG